MTVGISWDPGGFIFRSPQCKIARLTRNGIVPQNENLPPHGEPGCDLHVPSYSAYLLPYRAFLRLRNAKRTTNGLRLALAFTVVSAVLLPWEFASFLMRFSV